MKPIEMEAIINRKKYSTRTATLLAGDDWWDGNNYERKGRNTFLYRTPRGSYFAVHQTCWQGERDYLQPLTVDEAISYYETLTERRVSYEDAFPGVQVEEA
ncbi:MAG: hypothetical protein C4521_07595 [Actinobacteria bacterium]|nr:MAG: hypothetical protein C4521_07595 [Actinomycetota bacterium]